MHGAGASPISRVRPHAPISPFRDEPIFRSAKRHNSFFFFFGSKKKLIREVPFCVKYNDISLPLFYFFRDDMGTLKPLNILVPDRGDDVSKQFDGVGRGPGRQLPRRNGRQHHRGTSAHAKKRASGCARPRPPPFSRGWGCRVGPSSPRVRLRVGRVVVERSRNC